MDPSQLPDFDRLPSVEGMPQGCAWGVFDKDGKKDLLGTLNLLTPPVIANACKEARDGVSISLNLPLNGMKLPLPGRCGVTHTLRTLVEAGMSQRSGWDDELHFNTQSSSQWDSLVHFNHHPSGLAYNGIHATREALSAPHSGSNETPTLDHWHGKGGLVARGVLIDYKAWCEATKPEPYHPFDEHRIEVSEIEAIANYQGVEFRPGDVLILRTGVSDICQNPQPADYAKMQSLTSAGMHGCLESAKWLWNKHFSAVAGDGLAFEALMPIHEDGSPGTVDDLVLHPWLLSMFGMSMGELWDLKALGEYCKKTSRYSFLLTSAPLNIPGLVGSPPNALAIF